MLIFLVAGVLCTLSAQDIFPPAEQAKTIQAIAISGTLRIDGVADETEWLQALPVSAFVQVEPHQGQSANYDTEVRVLYNSQYLYIAAFCKDQEGRSAIRVPDLRRDFNQGAHDFFGVSIDPFGDKRNAMLFMTNPYGTQRDLLSFDDRRFDTDWDGLWRVRTSRTDSGWVAEIAIPWETLRYPDSNGQMQQWGINFFRNRRKTNELTGWSPYPRAFSALRMEYAGLLTNLMPPPPSPNIQIQPYVLVTSEKSKGQQADNALKAGGEVKWAVNPNTVLDVTFNTDFAQADVDRQVNNITRFSVFFPERRQFFLENASLFTTGLAPADNLVGGNMRIQPFFSRQIGLDAQGNPVPIDAGARLVSRSAKRNIGGILMHQRSDGDATGAATFAVARYSQNIGRQNRLGLLATTKHSQAIDTLPANTSATFASDGFFRISQALAFNFMLTGTTGSQQTDRGMAAFAQFTYNANNLVAWFTQSVVTENYNPAVGFVSRYDVVATTPGFFFVLRPEWKPKFIRGFEPGLFAEVYHQISTGRITEAQISFNPVWLAMESGAFLGIFVTPTWQILDSPFRPLGIQINPGNYNYLRYSVMTGSDQSRKVSFNINYENGGYFDGRLQQMRLSLRSAPLPHISLGVNYEENRFSELGVAATNATVRLVGADARLALNPRVQLIGFYQKNTSDDRDVWNIRLAWEFRPLSFLYLVYNKRSFTQFNERQDDRNVIGKISYLKQF